LSSDEAWGNFQAKQQRLQEMKTMLERTKLTPAMIEKLGNANLEELRNTNVEELSKAHVGTAALGCPAEQSAAAAPQLSAAMGHPLAQLLKRPEVTIEQLVAILKELKPEFFERNSSVSSVPSVVKLSSEVRNELKSVETEIKYEGYLLQQQRAMDRLKKSEQHSIPEWFDYHSVSGLSREMQEKLSHVRPRTIGQASRIPGVTPAAVSLVNVFIEIQARRREQAAAL